MKAAVISSFDRPPRYTDVPTPTPSTADEVLVAVIAAALHPRVRSQADGSHYTSTGVLPLVPGIDGVGRDPDGRLRYFVLPDAASGSMASHTVIDRRRSIVLPDDTDPVAVAAAMNPAMSSWIALRRRAPLRAGDGVLVLGATGSAGRLAVQIATLLGAGQVVAAGRDPDRLAGLSVLGATAVVPMGDGAGLARAARDVDVVLDYVWGDPAAAALTALVPDRGRPLTWIQIGAVAGPTAPIPSAALRAIDLRIVGSGQGSVSTRDIIAELPALGDAIVHRAIDVAARPVPLADVTRAWNDTATTDRVVLVPG